MPLPETSLSRACRSIADFIQSSFTASGHPIQVRLGTPAAAQPATTDTEHRLNLFFHRFEPMGFGSHELPNQTFWIRVYGIITAFAVDEDRISAGESDLRLIGEVLRLFHETPVLAPIDVGGEVMQAQMVLQPLGLAHVRQELLLFHLEVLDLAKELADGLVEYLLVGFKTYIGHKPALLTTQQVARTANIEIAHGYLEAAAQFAVLFACHIPLKSGFPFAVRPGDWAAVGITASDAPVTAAAIAITNIVYLNLFRIVFP